MTGRTSANVRGVLVLALAVPLAVAGPLRSLRTRPWREAPSMPARADAIFAKTRDAVRPGERIAVLVPPLARDVEMEFWYCAQYALAPRLVEPVLWRECTAPRDGAGCRMARSARLALVNPPAEVVRLAQQKLGTRAVGWAGPVLLMEATAP
jgi:hypothetical protein